MRAIKLTQGKIALVDDQNYDWLNQWKWCARRGHGTFYAVRNVSVAKGKREAQYMHRKILGLHSGDKQQTDHIDGNGLNNQRANLRFCTAAQNIQSSRKWKFGVSIYKGIFWRRNDRKWQTQIRVNKKLVHVGLFSSEIEASKAYDAAALKYFGEFAFTNKMMRKL